MKQRKYISNVVTHHTSIYPTDVTGVPPLYMFIENVKFISLSRKLRLCNEFVSGSVVRV